MSSSSSSPRRQGSRHSPSRSASNTSFRSSRSSQHRNTAQQTSDTGHRSPRRQHSNSPTRPNIPRSASPSPSRGIPRKRFGLNVPSNQPRFVGKFDFEEKYPDDPINEEMGPNARVWRAFLDECEVFDADMVTEARDGLDLHLVFAGLFSAVLTTFVAQTSQALSTNFPALSTSLLIEIVALQRAQVNNTPINTIPSSPTTSGPSGFDIWVNALWFTSLALSLGTALITVLVKQWLYQYMAMISGTARDRSLIRHYRFDGLQRWHVLTIIGTLPIVLHVALGLFLAGLVVFLIPLNLPLASIVGLITALIYTAYITSNILPLIYTHCPYRTPFSDILNVLTPPILTLPSLARAQIHKILPFFGKVVSMSPQEAFKTLKEAERIASTVDDVAEDVACSALSWLHRMTSNPPTRRIIQESLGCLSHAMSQRIEDISLPSFLINEMTQYNPKGSSIIQGQEKRVERLLRGSMRYPLFGGNWQLDPNAFELPFQTVAALLSRNRDIIVKMESQTWNRDQFLVYLIRQHLYEQPIDLPSVLWARLISCAYTDGVPQLTGNEDDMFLLSLCKLALFNFSLTAPRIRPFSGPVRITDHAVPLFQFVVDLIAARLGNVCPADTFESELLTRLFIIHNYAISRLPLVGSSGAALSVMSNVWERSSRVKMLSKKDTHALCERAENVVLQKLTFEDGWYGIPNNNLLSCYGSILDTYGTFCDSHISSPEFSQKLVSDFCSSLTTPSYIKYSVSKASQKIFRQRGTNASVYWTLLLRSPIFTTWTLASLSSSREYLYPVLAAFTSHFTGGDALPRVAALRCMDDLSADPERLYTVCRVIALGDDRLTYSADHEGWEGDLKQHLLQLVRFDPTHAVWTQRAHYMGMDPRDWPYLRLTDEDLDDEATLAHVKERMNVGLAILDEFFASFNQSSSAAPFRPVSSWGRIRCFVPASIGRIFRPPPSNVGDMELGLRTFNGVDNSRHIATAAPHTSLSSQDTPMPSQEIWFSIPSQTSPAEVAPGESSHTELRTQMTSPVRTSSSRSNVLGAPTERFLDPSSVSLTEHESSEEVSDESSRVRHSTNPDVDGIVQATGASNSVPSNPLDTSTDIV